MTQFTVEECNKLFSAMDAIEYSKDSTAAISTKFRYNLNYNMQKLQSIINETRQVLKLPESSTVRYREYIKSLQDLVKVHYPKGKDSEPLNDIKQKEYEIMKSKLDSEYQDVIAEAKKKENVYKEKLASVIEFNFRYFLLSQMPDLSSNSSNDALMYFLQQKNLIIDDTQDNKPLKSESAPSQVLGVTGIASEETLGDIGKS